MGFLDEGNPLSKTHATPGARSRRGRVNTWPGCWPGGAAVGGSAARSGPQRGGASSKARSFQSGAACWKESGEKQSATDKNTVSGTLISHWHVFDTFNGFCMSVLVYLKRANPAGFLRRKFAPPLPWWVLGSAGG